MDDRQHVVGLIVGYQMRIETLSQPGDLIAEVRCRCSKFLTEPGDDACMCLGRWNIAVGQGSNRGMKHRTVRRMCGDFWQVGLNACLNGGKKTKSATQMPTRLVVQSATPSARIARNR